MSALAYRSRPQLRRPALVVAFEGWSDAGDAATSSLSYLRSQLDATDFASIDPEEFFDFQAHRPIVKLNDAEIREIVWPQTRFSFATVPAAERDVVLLQGVEPSMRWATFTSLIIDVARTVEADIVVGLGALLAGRPHTRPIRVTGTATTPALASRFGLATPRYEGPTGILGVLMDACRQADLPAVTLWAWVPHYLQGTPSPGASLSLLQRLASLIDLSIDLSDLEERTRSHRSRIEEAVGSDPEIATTVEELERQADAEDMTEMPSADDLAAEVEQYLRNQGPDR
jgi:predicted ATP-grasp superfamily ATP-dependent carboligase